MLKTQYESYHADTGSTLLSVVSVYSKQLALNSTHKEKIGKHVSLLCKTSFCGTRKMRCLRWIDAAFAVQKAVVIVSEQNKQMKNELFLFENKTEILPDKANFLSINSRRPKAGRYLRSTYSRSVFSLHFGKKRY